MLLSPSLHPHHFTLAASAFTVGELNALKEFLCERRLEPVIQDVTGQARLGVACGPSTTIGLDMGRLRWNIIWYEPDLDLILRHLGLTYLTVLERPRPVVLPRENGTPFQCRELEYISAVENPGKSRHTMTDYVRPGKGAIEIRASNWNEAIVSSALVAHVHGWFDVDVRRASIFRRAVLFFSRLRQRFKRRSPTQNKIDEFWQNVKKGQK